jgi:hypothetical protein
MQWRDEPDGPVAETPRSLARVKELKGTEDRRGSRRRQVDDEPCSMTRTNAVQEEHARGSMHERRHSRSSPDDLQNLTWVEDMATQGRRWS